MNAPPESPVLSTAEIARRLAGELPRWRLENGFLAREYKTRGWKATLMVVNAIGYLSETAWHHPDLHASFARVGVRLQTHDAGGVTEKDFALARDIEALVARRPGNEAGAEDGTCVEPDH